MRAKARCIEAGCSWARDSAVGRVSWPSLASYRPECPICLCRDACAFGAAERAGNALHSARVYLELGRRLAHAHAARQGRPDSLSQLIRDRRPAKSLTFTLGPLQASADALLNDRALELGKHAEHLKHGLASRRGRVETLLMQKQVYDERVKLGQERHQVFQAAAQAIDVPGHHYLELTLCAVPAQRIERWPSIAALSATDAVILVDLRHLPAGALRQGFCVHTRSAENSYGQRAQ